MKKAFLAILGAVLVMAGCQKQEAAAPELSLDPVTVAAGQAGTTATINVTCNGEWAVKSGAAWVTVKPAAGSGNGSLQIIVEATTSQEQRSAKVTVISGTLTKYVTVTQDPKPFVNVNPTAINAPFKGGEYELTVSANEEWKVESSQDWAVATKNGEKVKVVIATNDTEVEREAVVTVKGATVSTSVAVKQEGKSDPVALNGEYKYATIQAAVDAATAGSVITFKDGEYLENIKIVAGKDLTIKGASKAGSKIEGDVEVMGKAVLQDLTISSFKDVTKKEFIEGDTEYAWWGFIVRAGAGSTVVLDNVKVYAHPDFAGDTEACQYITAIFAAKAEVTVKNSELDLTSGKLFAPVQLFGCNAEFTNTMILTAETISAGCEAYGIKIADPSSTFKASKNSFDCVNAIYIVASGSYNFGGAITLGDGEKDDNTYSEKIEHALHSEAATASALTGVTFAPANVVLNKKTSQEGGDPEQAFKMEKAVLYTDLGVGNNKGVRNAAFDGENIYLLETGSADVETGAAVLNPVLWKVPVNLGAAEQMKLAGWTKGYVGPLMNVFFVDGKLYLANSTGPGNKWAFGNSDFCIFSYDAASGNLNQIFSTTIPDNMRAADCVCYESGAFYFGAGANTGKLYKVPFANGVASKEVVYDLGCESTFPVASYAMHDGIIYRSAEGSPAEILKLDGNSVTKVKTAATQMKYPSFFKIGSKDYVAYVSADNRVEPKQDGVICTIYVAPYDATSKTIDEESAQVYSYDMKPADTTTATLNANHWAQCFAVGGTKSATIYASMYGCGIVKVTFTPAE